MANIVYIIADKTSPIVLGTLFSSEAEAEEHRTQDMRDPDTWEVVCIDLDADHSVGDDDGF